MPDILSGFQVGFNSALQARAQNSLERLRERSLLRESALANARIKEINAEIQQAAASRAALITGMEQFQGLVNQGLPRDLAAAQTVVPASYLAGQPEMGQKFLQTQEFIETYPQAKRIAELEEKQAQADLAKTKAETKRVEKLTKEGTSFAPTEISKLFMEKRDAEAKGDTERVQAIQAEIDRRQREELTATQSDIRAFQESISKGDIVASKALARKLGFSDISEVDMLRVKARMDAIDKNFRYINKPAEALEKKLEILDEFKQGTPAYDYDFSEGRLKPVPK